MSDSQFSYHKKPPERYPENVQGDFYVENQVCISCGAPEFEAPDLIDHSKKEYTHCFFKKQPQTPDEIDRAINAMQVSCIAGVRYGGKDEAILKRLYELGMRSECDYSPSAFDDISIPSQTTHNKVSQSFLSKFFNSIRKFIKAKK